MGDHTSDCGRRHDLGFHLHAGPLKKFSRVFPSASNALGLLRLSCTPSRARHSWRHGVILALAVISLALSGGIMSVSAWIPGTDGFARKFRKIFGESAL